MDLFSTSENENILPFEGEARYYGSIMNLEKSQYYFDRLLNYIEWENDKAIIFGKLVITKRKVAWYGDKAFDYTYSKTTKSGLPWTKELLELKSIVENKTGETFNSCLLNLYHNGDEGMGWHSDGEKDLKINGAIGSLSFGAERKFLFKHKKTKQTVEVYLEKGSLLVMKGETQTHWLHRLPPTKKVKFPRINLTFRTIDL
ncbi:alpha-ketoglutarate-dependent dioxygenase AlkB [Algibacter miyuki]|uniref:Alpha-ketoglutarate-dependent dioxygenase AlkB n=1 Tax=Algibacter miyuki TaxID=1306933 RepID=A0ABV5H339_9FLAO|nr:alpha-ketoglutarate-dependent dioxygenase AlkB [Algibacter miyuki]MDN3665368.1 alpha-ketoglutarate-dependent dioxygenase AlkB [Algibacter miyuki]